MEDPISFNGLVIFADVAGSTALYEKYGDVMAQQRISNCLNTVSAIISSQTGQIVKYIGDEILFYFENLIRGVEACCAIQQAFREDETLISLELGMRIGFHSGRILLKEQDIFGDTVNTAARMASLAQEGQIICDRETLNSVNKAFDFRSITTLQVKGKKDPMDICEVIWAPDDTDLTFVSTKSGMSQFTNLWSLNIKYLSFIYQLNQTKQKLAIGRGLSSDIQIDSQHASRNHAQIISRRGKAILVDQSTNGTFITNEQGDELYVHREEVTLGQQGYISLGLPVKNNRDQALTFSILWNS